MKKLLILIIFIFSFSLLPFSVRAATEFITTIKASGGDYSTLSSWEDAIECDLTTAFTYAYDNASANPIPDATAITWGVDGVGTLLHMTTVAKSGADTFLLTKTSGTSPANNDVITDGTNTITVNGTPDSVIAIAKIDGAWASADTTLITIDGWTTSAANYIRIYTTAAARHNGKWDTTKYRIDRTSYAEGLTVYENYVRIEGLQFQMNQSYVYTVALISSGGLIKFSHNIVKGNYSGSTTGGIGIYISDANGTFHIYNNLVYDFINPGYTGFVAMQFNDGAGYIYNNTVHNSYTGIYNGTNGTRTFKNNIVNDCSNTCWSLAGAAGSASTYNITNTSAENGAWGTVADSGTTDGAAANKLIQPGQNFLTTVKVGMIVKNTTDTTYSYVTAVDSDTQLSINDDIMAAVEAYTIYTNMYGNVAFLDEAGDDFHLDSTDTVAKDKGTDLSGESIFTDDIDGVTRSGTWDIGADEYVPSTDQKNFQFFNAGDELPHYDISTLVIGAGNVTGSGNASADTTPDIAYPNYSVGDLLIQVIAADGDLAITAPANGPNGETINVILADTKAVVTAGPHLMVVYWIATSNVSASTIAWTIAGAGEEWDGQTIRVPTGEFDATTPIYPISAAGLKAANAAVATMPTFTCGRVGGRVVAVGGIDTDPMDATFSPVGWTDIYDNDRGTVTSFCGIRDAAITVGETIASADFATDSDTSVCVGFVVNALRTADGRTAFAAAGADVELDVDTDYGWQFRLENIGAASDDDYKLQYKLNAGSWTDITDSSSVIKAGLTEDFANGANVPEYITGAGTYDTDNSAALENAGAFTLGAALANSHSFEGHLNFQIVSGDVVDTDTIQLRVVYGSGTALEIYTDTPTITVSEEGGLNSAPTITSVTDYPDPLEAGKTITFSVDWNDADTEGIYMYICKAEDGGTSGCGAGGTWCSYTDTYTTTDPITCTYAVQTADVGVKNFYAYVCDNEPTCSSATSGTFTVQSASTGSIRIQGGTRFQGGVRFGD